MRSAAPKKKAGRRRMIRAAVVSALAAAAFATLAVGPAQASDDCDTTSPDFSICL